MSDGWNLDERRKFAKAVYDHFASSTDADLQGCIDIAICLPIEQALEAMKKLRDGAGGSIWRPNLSGFRTIVSRMKPPEASGPASRFNGMTEEQRTAQRASNEQQKAFWESVAEAGAALSDADLAEWKARYLEAHPEHRDIYASRDPRKTRSLMAAILEYGAKGVPA